jgi:diguanylate cyclase (GGDEF)-like protein
VTALVNVSPQGRAFLRLLILLTLAVIFEETSRSVDRLRLRITEGVYTDMTSVWLVSGAIVLPGAYALTLVVLVRGHMWIRHQRRDGMRAHRQLFTAASMVLACLGAGALIATVAPLTEGPSSALGSALVVVVGLVVYTLINTGLVSGAMYLANRPERFSVVVGSWGDNALEIATLCLGALTALAILHQPWLTVLVLPPMFTLQRSALVKQLEEAASTDAKTGLLNAVAWEQLAGRELSRAQRERASAAVLIIDLDHFKAVNDIHGHLAGDAVLKGIGKCLTRELRGYDTVGRFGGEEFVAILPGVDVAGGMEIAERVRQRIAELRTSALTGIEATGTEAALSASIGVACYPVHGTEVDQLLRAADTGLYRAKRSGRNRVELAHDDPPTQRESVRGY